jgi:hypothetical protein
MRGGFGIPAMLRSTGRVAIRQIIRLLYGIGKRLALEAAFSAQRSALSVRR